MLHNHAQTPLNHLQLDAPRCALLAILGTVAENPSPFDKLVEKARACAAPLWCPVLDLMGCAFHQAHARDMFQAFVPIRYLDRSTPYVLSKHGWASFRELMSGGIKDSHPLAGACIVLKLQFIYHVEEHRQADILNEIEQHLTCERRSAVEAAQMCEQKPAEGFARSSELARINCGLAWIQRLRHKRQSECTA